MLQLQRIGCQEAAVTVEAAKHSSQHWLVAYWNGAQLLVVGGGCPAVCTSPQRLCFCHCQRPLQQPPAACLALRPDHLH